MKGETRAKIEMKTVTRRFTVSWDGTWRKRGVSSLFGASSLIGHYSCKVLDFTVKSSYYKMCEETSEFLQWREKYEIECLANHEVSVGKMEVDIIKEIFGRSEKLYSVKYINYICGGDSKTCTSIVNSAPYEDAAINKK